MFLINKFRTNLKRGKRYVCESEPHKKLKTAPTIHRQDGCPYIKYDIYKSRPRQTYFGDHLPLSFNPAYHLTKDWAILWYKPFIIIHYVSSLKFFVIFAKTVCKNYRLSRVVTQIVTKNSFVFVPKNKAFATLVFVKTYVKECYLI